MKSRDRWRIVAGYAVVSAIYILFSGRIVGAIATDPAEIVRIEVWKGWGFVLVSSLVLGVLLRRIHSVDQDRYRAVFENQHAVMLLVDPLDGRIVDANARAEQFYGVSRIALRGRLLDALDAQPHAESGPPMQGAAGSHQGEFHFRHWLASGEPREVLVRSGPIEFDGRRLLLSVVHDETEQRCAERDLRRSNRLYRMLSQTNKLIVRARDRRQLLEAVCEIAVREGGFLFAWIGMEGPDAKVHPAARAGCDSGYIDAVHASLLDADARSSGPTARAMRRGEVVVSNDFLADPTTGPWHDEARLAGVRASASFPIRNEERTLGSLNVYAGETDHFDPYLTETLTEMASDIAFALESQQHRQSLSTIAEVVDASPSVLFRWLPEPGWPVAFVTGNIAQWGYAAHDLLSGAVPFARLVHAEDAARVAAEVEKHSAAGASGFAQEYRILTHGGEVRWIEDQTTVVRDGAGRVECYQGLVTDVTEQRRTAQALHELSDRLEQYLALSPTVIYVMVAADDGLRVVWVSDNIERLLGYGRDEVLDPAWWLKNLHPADREAAIAAFAQIGMVDRAQHDYRFLRKDRGVVWVHDEIRLRRDAGGAVAQVVGSWTDISEARDAQLRLHRSEERLRLALEASHQGIYDLDIRTGAAVVTPEYAQMLGEDPATFRETNSAWIERLHPEDSDRVAGVYRAYVAGSIPEYRVEFRQRLRDGSWKWILSIGRIVERDAGGAPLRLLGTHTDIDEIKRSEERYRLLFAANPQPMWVYDTATLRFLAVNDAALHHYGYSRAEFLAMSIADIRPPEDLPRLLAAVAALPDDPSDAPGVWRHRLKDGTLIQVEIISQLIEYDGHRAELVLVRDISGRLRLERQRDEAEQRYRVLVEQSLVGVVLLRNGLVEYSNPRAREIFGIAADDPARLDLPRLIHADDRAGVLHALARVESAEDAVGSFECRALRPDGATVLIGGQATRTELDRESVVIALLQDITAKLRAEQEAARYLAQLEHAMSGTVDAISRMMDLRDPYTSGHQRRVGEIAAAIGAELGLDEHSRHGLSIAGALHDIGKITVPSEILSKPGRLSTLEYEIIKSHAQQGYEVLQAVDFAWPVAEVARQHHERLDGSGYPRGLRGDEILPEARIMAVADVVESMASHRPYRPTLGVARALEEIEAGRGTRYDAAVVDACLRLFRERGYEIPA